ncbi:MAG: S41 family peptidase, partial [Proteobacteria bacterium]
LYGFVSALSGSPTAVAAGEAPKDGKDEGKPSAIVSNAKYDDIALFGRVINFIEKQYVDKVNTRELVYGAIKGMLETLDPHSNFMPPDVYSQLKSDTAGKFGGLGIEVWVNKDGVLTIVTPMEGTPAWKAGVKPGDRIMRINGESTKGMSIVEATTRIRGEIGSEVKFTVARDGAPKPIDFKMKRVTIDVKSVKAELLEEKFAYVKLNHFQEKTAQEVKAALAKMESKRKISGMILDLRNNPGGLLDEAVDTVNLFVDKGPIVSTIGRNKEEKDVKYAKSGIARLDFPMVVLVNGSSASAAEIVSGALKDHKRALVAGSRTFGKGSVQTVIPLADDVG